MNRNLDGYFFRVKRGDEYRVVCFSDLTEDEMRAALLNRGEDWLKSLAIGLGQTIRTIGDNLDITGEG